MKRSRKSQPKQPYVGTVVRLTGLRYAAGVLGVHESHLRRVIQGKRDSDALLARVRARFPALLKGAA